MRTLEIEAVVAFDRNDFGIGAQNTLPWKLPKDMKRFREITKGHAVLMGTQTALSIGRALPGRTNYVLTRSGETPYKDQIPVASMQGVVNHLTGCTEEKVVKLFVIGGEEVYRWAMPFLTGIHMTIVYGPPKTPHDRFFPYDNYATYFGDNMTLCGGRWVDDGEEDNKITTQYDHIVFPARSGVKPVSLPIGWRLGRFGTVERLPETNHE